MLAKTTAVILSFAAFAPSAASVSSPSQPGPWRLVGKVATSRAGAKLHVERTVQQDMQDLAFVVTSRSPRRIHVQWVNYCEFMSDDDYTEWHQGKLSGLKRVESYPKVFDGATHCDLSINTAAIRGARVTVAVFAH